VMQAYIGQVKKEVGFKSSVKLQKAAAE
jgi:hypothetical protein